MELILDQWEGLLRSKLKNCFSLKIIVPSFSMVTIKLLDEYDILQNTEIITRYSLYDFFVKLSDIQALKLGVSKGMSVYGIKNLHSKIYIFNDIEAIITSSNFTYGGVFRNHECGILIDNFNLLNELIIYFEKLRSIGENKLILETCESWEEELKKYREDILTPYMLPDYGKLYI